MLIIPKWDKNGNENTLRLSIIALFFLLAHSVRMTCILPNF